MNVTTLKKYKAESKLERATKRIILNHVEKDYFESWFSDLLSYGCVSGMIGELIYYCDTEKFYKKHKEEINEMLKDYCLFGVFGDKFDSEDQLCLETSNRNLLAWFAFEETTRKIANEIGLEL